MKWGLLLIAIIPVAANAKEPNWIPIGHVQTGASWFVDVDDVGRGSNDYWVKIDYSNDKTEKFRSSVRLMRIDCRSRKIGDIQAVSYLPDGSAKTYGPEIYPSMGYAVPGTIGDTLLEMYCPPQENRGAARP